MFAEMKKICAAFGNIDVTVPRRCLTAVGQLSFNNLFLFATFVERCEVRVSFVSVLVSIFEGTSAARNATQV